MADDTKKWKPELSGNAKTAFNQAKDAQPKPPVKAVEAQGRGSEMVKKDQLILDGPKPPGGARQAVVRQDFQRKISQEAAAAKSAEPQVSGNLRKPVIELEHLKEGAKLREKFRAAARKEQERDR
jgi:hypothetical protein